MAESADDPHFHFYKPKARALLPIADLHISRSLLKKLKKRNYAVYINRHFERVIDLCAAAQNNRPSTWINKTIRDTYVHLHQAGHAHTVEIYNDDDEFIGGLYGLALGGVFCGESMVSLKSDASKMALCYLAAHLWQCGFSLLDAQLHNPHLEQFGLFTIEQKHYEDIVEKEMEKNLVFTNKINFYDLENYLKNRHQDRRGAFLFS